MLGKLIKYEMKSILRVLIPVYIGLIALAIWVRIMLDINANNSGQSVSNVISAISVLAYVFMIFATGIITFIVIIKRYYKSVLCDEGYLTNTLPVKPESIIVSKMIAALLWAIISVVIIYLSGIILGASANPDKNENFMETMGTLAFIGIGVDQSATRVGMIIADIICMLSQTLHIYAAISLGHLLSKHRVLGAFAAFIGLGIVFSIINGVLSAEFRINVASSLQASLFSSTALIFRSVGYAVQGIIYFIITDYVLKKRLNLE